jgi:Flp pilus assembly protein TadG
VVYQTSLVAVAGKRRRRTECCRSGARKGSALVETALVLPILLLFLLGIMEYGRYFFVLQLATNAAREGCRYAVTHTNPVTLGGTTTGNATSDVTNTVSNFLAGQQLSSQSVQVYQSDSQGNNIGAWTGATPGEFVCVQITGNFQITVPKLLSFPGTVPVKVQSVMLCEGN